MDRRQRLRSLILIGGASGVLAFGTSAPAHAWQHWPNNYHLTYGVSGQQYWVGPDASPYSSGIDTAVGNWNSASGPVSYSKTTVQANSRLDWTYPGTSNGACANTLFFVNTTNVQDANGNPTSNYWWAKVQIRPDINNSGACGPGSHRKGIFGHEMGHALGLAHVHGGALRLMDRDIAFPDHYSVNAPTSDDVNGVNNLY